MAKDYNILNELTPKTVELHRAIFDKGYEQGYNEGIASHDGERGSIYYGGYGDGHKDGLNDAWECARKILYSPDFWGYTCEELEKIFDIKNIENMTDTVKIFKKFSPSEAIAKIKEYEEKQKADSNKVTRQSIIKSQLMDIVNGQENPVTADEIAEVLEQLKEAEDETK